MSITEDLSQGILESDGMFEIKAIAEDGTPLLIADKPIEVDLKHTSGLKDLSQYYFNVSDRKWEVIGVVDIDEYLWDTVHQKNEAVVPTYIKPQKADEKNFQIAVAYDQQQFKALSLYEHILFEVDRDHPNFNNDYYKVKWDQVDMEKKEDSIYVLRLRKFDNTIEFEAYPVFKGAHFDQAMETYQAWQQTCKVKQEGQLYTKKAKSIYREQYSSANNASLSFVTTQQIFTTFVTRNLGLCSIDRAIIPPPSECYRIEHYIDEETAIELQPSKVDFLAANRSVVYPQLNPNRICLFSNMSGRCYVKVGDQLYQTKKNALSSSVYNGNTLYLKRISKTKYNKRLN